ncbi:hypothetical protein [Streptomyces sp. CLCI03]
MIDVARVLTDAHRPGPGRGQAVAAAAANTPAPTTVPAAPTAPATAGGVRVPADDPWAPPTRTVPCGIGPRILRSTRLADLVNTLDPKLVAAVLGMHPEGIMIYFSDPADAGRLPDQQERRQ